VLKTKMFVTVSFFLVVVLFIAILPGSCSSSGEEQIELRVGWMMHIPSMDPVNVTNNWEIVSANNIYDSLIYPSPNPEILGEPWIAKSWEVSNDAKTYTFYLKEGIKFHDGSEVRAEDVAFSIDRQQILKGTIAAYFKDIKAGTTKVIDNYTVVFHLEKPDPSFLASLFCLKILNKDQILKHKKPGNFGEFGDYGVNWLDTHDAGSGPYKLVKRIHGDGLVLEKFKDYSLRKWEPNSIDRVRIYIIPELVTMSIKMKKGELDIADQTMSSETMKELEAIEGIRVELNPINSPWYLILNNKKPPLDDVYVRKAMAYAFDYETVIKDILVGGVRSQGPVPNAIAGHNNNLLVYTRDIEKAKELIKKSKYSEEELSNFELEIASVTGSKRFENVSLLAAANFKEIGLNCKVKNVRWADICQHQAKPETAFNIVVFYQAALVPHPQFWLVYYTPEGWGTVYPPGGIYYNNPEVTELIKKAKNAPSIEEQFKYYRKAQELIVEDCPCIFMHNDLLAQPIWRYVKGYKCPVGAENWQLRFDNFLMDTSDEFYKYNHR